jgi:predicted DNA-binding transcriptional regulator YafY
MFEGGSFFSIDCVENYELIRELCSFGAELVVLSPKEISQEITSRVKKMYDRYKKLS